MNDNPDSLIVAQMKVILKLPEIFDAHPEQITKSKVKREIRKVWKISRENRMFGMAAMPIMAYLKDVEKELKNSETGKSLQCNVMLVRGGLKCH
jgi:hypothetical protein